MAKRNRISALQISSQSTQEITLEGKVKTIVVKNSGTSANALNVGFNESASDKISLPAGEGLALSLDDGTVFDGNRVYAAFSAANPNNTGFMIIIYELEEETC